MDDLITEFITETNESLADLDADLIQLEQNPGDKDLLSRVFRILHTIKGTCGFLGLPRLESVAHKAEDVLGLFREGELEVTQDYVTLIFESLDRIKYIVDEIAQTGKEPEGDDSALILQLETVYKNANGEAPPAPQEMPPIVIPDDDDDLGDLDMDALDAIIAAQEAQEKALEESAKDVPQELDGKAPAKNKKEQSPPPIENKEAVEKTASKAAAAPQSLRVNVEVLEDLMTMVSELVLTRNQLLQIMRKDTESEFTGPLQRLNHVVSELQEGVMKTRMQPIGNAWAKLPRIIRDIAIELDKKIDLDMNGQDTELDRQVLELIKDPLTHMVRNSADHGLEDPAQRLAAGKPETGKIRLNAFHEGGHIIIEIADDGRGLAVEKIKQKALKNGLASEEELAAMPDQQIQQFIFNPGFSTADQITAVSGRGVGMDVVRTNIEKIGGSIELHSTEGKGTTFTIKIPLTLAIVSALIVEAGGQRFAVPQLSVRELVMTSRDEENSIETIKGTPVFRLRDRLLPLVSLQEILKMGEDKTRNALQNTGDAESNIDPVENKNALEKDRALYTGKYIVVTQVGSYTFGIIVDRVYDTEEIVIKPVSKVMKDIDVFSGNTILGDGSVIMILDPAGIAKSTGKIEMADATDVASLDTHKDHAAEKISMLLFDAGQGAPKAVPLELVSRLEDVKVGDIEYAGEKMVVQYRGDLMTLIPFNDHVNVNEDDTTKTVLVFADESRAMGLIVNRIIDIVEDRLEMKAQSTQNGIVGSAIVNGQSTDVVDVTYFLGLAHGSWFKDHDDTPYKKNGHMREDEDFKRILLVDDSPFFRNILTPLLKSAGYHVLAVDSALKALELCRDGLQFDCIISDIEMPEMDGFEFAEAVKGGSGWDHIPLVALTSHATEADKNRGLEAGFSRYIAKFDRQTLLKGLTETLAEQTNTDPSQREAI